MRPNSKQLALRDPALAALCGLTGQPDFGFDPNDAERSSGMAAWDAEHGQYNNAGQLDRDPIALLSHPLFRGRQGGGNLSHETIARLKLMDPNWGSSEKIGRYSFSIPSTLVLGSSEAINATNSPLNDIKPERLIFNAPCYNFALINVVQIGNTSVLVGASEDAFNYNAQAVDVRLDMPLLLAGNRALVAGEYTGISPAPFASGTEYNFVATFHGPARMVT